MVQLIGLAGEAANQVAQGILVGVERMLDGALDVASPAAGIKANMTQLDLKQAMLPERSPFGWMHARAHEAAVVRPAQTLVNPLRQENARLLSQATRTKGLAASPADSALGADGGATANESRYPSKRRLPLALVIAVLSGE